MSSLRSIDSCRDCGTEIAQAILSCPACGVLVFAEELRRLASQAQTTASPVEALTHWRSALVLLPPGSQQSEIISGKIETLRQHVDSAGLSAPAPAQPATGKPARTGVIAAVLLIGGLLMKFKFVIALLLSKGKLLILGFSKASTVLTMLLSFGLYWTAWGWKFAAGFVLSIYVHEMGHVAKLRHYGIRASAPMFIPGFGAIVRLKEALNSPIENARVGLAGPIWGLGAAVAAWALSIAFESPMMAAIAKTGAWINLFNLLPVWQLDGARAFHALSKIQRWLAAAFILGTFLATSEHLLLFILAVAIIRAFGKDAAPQSDGRTLFEYCFLTATLAAFKFLPIALPPA